MTNSSPSVAHPTTRLIRALVCALVVSAFAALAAPEARASDPAQVLALNVDGSKLADADRAALLTTIKTKLGAYPDLRIVKAPDGDITDQMIDLECIDLDAQCLGKLATKYQAARVVHADVSKKGKNLVLHLRIIAADSAVVIDKTDEAKDLASLTALLDSGIEAAFGPVPVVAAKGTLVVEVASPYAVIYLGQQQIGTGTATVELEPGDYTIRITNAGSEEVIRKVRVTSAETTTERVQLTAIAVVPPKKTDPDEADSGSGWVLWVVIGAAVVGGTIAAIALTQDSGDTTVRGPAVLGIDPAGAWRDPATFGGRK